MTLRNEASRSTESRRYAIYQFLESKGGGATVGDQHHVGALRQRTSQGANGLTDPPLRSVALNRAADPTSSRDADARGTGFAAQQHVRHDGRRRRLPAFGVRPADVRGGGETVRSWHQTSAAR